MKKFKSHVVLLFLILTTFTLIGCLGKSQYKSTALEPVETLIKTLYFNKGNYKDYKAIFTNPNNAFNEDQFKKFREKPDKTAFKYGANSLEDIVKHMKLENVNETSAVVYYVEDVNKTDKSKALMQWKVEKRDGKWLLKND
ncbi:hypothetical protein RBU49_00645 [Clostridium sp. MB40-C1]|uniref:hypothetical protein n=1 Tax=Clostridium sp. MB40-C1 TaxID=3070996 RepID=UPI0027DF7882|nr:hypothetical protein [Clostridium sp. MB40-C1]WMJ80785.1 hypothetical protein RBU49_00645 [Clostridium sp. MB40-C1]